MIPTANDIEAHKRYKTYKYMPVHILYSRKEKRTVKHTSLAHYYNEWYQEYRQSTSFPRLIVRMEDLIFRGEELVAQVCECAGGESLRGDSFVHVKKTAKGGTTSHATAHTGLLEAIETYGNASNRRVGWAANQLQAAKDLLDPELMNLFGYHYEDP